MKAHAQIRIFTTWILILLLGCFGKEREEYKLVDDSAETDVIDISGTESTTAGTGTAMTETTGGTSATTEVTGETSAEEQHESRVQFDITTISVSPVDSEITYQYVILQFNVEYVNESTGGVDDSCPEIRTQPKGDDVLLGLKRYDSQGNDITTCLEQDASGNCIKLSAFVDPSELTSLVIGYSCPKGQYCYGLFFEKSFQTAKEAFDCAKDPFSYQPLDPLATSQGIEILYPPSGENTAGSTSEQSTGGSSAEQTSTGTSAGEETTSGGTSAGEETKSAATSAGEETSAGGTSAESTSGGVSCDTAGETKVEISLTVPEGKGPCETMVAEFTCDPWIPDTTTADGDPAEDLICDTGDITFLYMIDPAVCETGIDPNACEFNIKFGDNTYLVANCQDPTVKYHLVVKVNGEVVSGDVVSNGAGQCNWEFDANDSQRGPFKILLVTADWSETARLSALGTPLDFTPASAL